MRHESTRCDRCGHERYYHLDHHGQPAPCAAKDDGEQCASFVEPQRRFTLAEVEKAFDLVDSDSLDEWRTEFLAALTGGGT